MSNDSLHVLAHFRALPGKESELAVILQALIEPTRAEPGCIAYVLLRSREDSGRFTFVEEWTGEPALQQHFQTDHIRAGRFTPEQNVVFVHTGGTPALFAYNEALADRIPAAYGPVWRSGIDDPAQSATANNAALGIDLLSQVPVDQFGLSVTPTCAACFQ